MVTHTLVVTLALGLYSVLFIQPVQAIRGATMRDACNYPGVVALELRMTKVITCHGLMDDQGSILIPKVCYDILLKHTSKSSITAYYGKNGKNSTHEIPKQGLKGFIEKGVFHLDASDFNKDGVCSPEATMYDESKHTLKPDSCEVVSYGPPINAATEYLGALMGTKITKSTGAGCCPKIMKSMASLEAGAFPNALPRNCLTSEGSTCGVADIGSPVYCDTTDGTKVAIGISASSPCKDDERGNIFTAHDLTSGSDTVKFGISS